MGCQTPTDALVPKFHHTELQHVVGLAEMTGVQLDPWQKTILEGSLGRRADGQWSAPTVGVIVGRQNGKSALLEIRALAGLFLFNERLVVYTAHKGETVMGAFNRIVGLIEEIPEFNAELKPRSGIKYTNGKEAIELRDGRMIKFRTRTPDGGRGLSGDCVILDEAQNLNGDHISALLPTMLARPNPQTYYVGTAGNRQSEVLAARLRDYEAGRKRMAFYAWLGSDDTKAHDPKAQARLNPAYGRRITSDNLETTYLDLGPTRFLRECMGVGDWPRVEGEDWVIPSSIWNGPCLDKNSAPTGKVVLALDAKPDLEWGSIGLAGDRKDKARHLEVADHQRGVKWMPARTAQILADNPVIDRRVLVDPHGPVGFLIPDLEELGVEVYPMTVHDVAGSFSWITAATKQPAGEEAKTWRPGLKHRGSPVLTAALASAATRNLLDRKAWRRQGEADISPIVAVSFAGYAVDLLARDKKPEGPAARQSGKTGHRTPPTRSPRRRRPRSETADLATAKF